MSRTIALISGLVSSLPSNLFLDGPELVSRLKGVLPFGHKHNDHIFKVVEDVLYGVIFGALVIIFLQGLTASIVFWAVGAPQPIFWGVVMAILALLPLIGTWIVWLPMGLGFIGVGNATNNPAMVWKGIIVLGYGLLVAVPLDSIVKPMVMGARSRVHPLLILVGVLGGLSVFGLIGVFIGPVILALLTAFFKIYEEERRTHKEA